MSVKNVPSPISGGLLSVRVADDLVLDGGTWDLTQSEDGQPIATINPPAAPMFQQVVEYLETKPVPRVGNFRRAAESRAAVAVCLRWGSYLALLADPSRPSASDIQHQGTSQIADDEMARMNIEISAGIAWWLAMGASDESRYWDLVHRAVAYLPTGPKSVRAMEGCERLSGCASAEMVTAVRSRWPADQLDQSLALAERYGIRAIANTITLYAWRNGPVENVHAGWGEGYEVGTRRVLPKAEKAIIRQAQSGLYTGLKVVDILKYVAGWPPPAEWVLPFLHPVIGPSRWSYTEQSRVIELPLRQDVSRNPQR